MTPIKWNGTTWVDTTAVDSAWYDYSNKQWANARTNDGSMWVWIPRYIYKISSNFHYMLNGTLQVQFSKGTNDNWNSATIGNINTDTAAAASNNTWTNHTGFTFGNTEINGFWIAKFEPTAVEGISESSTGDNVTTKTIQIIPNAVSWRNINNENIFINVRNMETKSVYGWSTSSGLQSNGSFANDGNNIDTHLIKNVEWAAVVYLAAATTYGKVEQIWKNPSTTYITGCAGVSVNPTATSGCSNTYETANGQQASTSGTIYGVYDMHGGGEERTATYVNNSNSNLNTYGPSIVTSDNKYKDIYTMGATDTGDNNYALTVNRKGDAVWETSYGNNMNGEWYTDYIDMPYTTSPFLFRGSYHSETVGGAFYLGRSNGSYSSRTTFRPIIVIES